MNNSLFNLHEVLLLVTSTEAVLLALGILLLPNSRPQSHWLLAGLLTLIATTLGATLLVWNQSLQQTGLIHSSVLIVVLAFGLLTQGPMLYWYMSSLSRKVNLLTPATALHLLPALGAILIIVGFDLTLYDWLPPNWSRIPASKHQAILFIWAGFKCLPLLYAVSCCIAEYRLRKQLRDRYSNLSFWELRGAEIVLGGFTLHWSWVFIAYWLSGYVSSPVNQMMGNISNYVTIALVNVLFIFTLWSGRKALILPEIPDPKRDHSVIEDDEIKLGLVNKGIDEKSLHLDPHINLERFAEGCQLKPREASSIINKHYQKNFFEFINFHRVQAVKERLRIDNKSTILEIALSSGFNSQSAFQRFFKRFEHMTPTQYRKKVAQSSDSED